jgi:hypothetical protein
MPAGHKRSHAIRKSCNLGNGPSQNQAMQKRSAKSVARAYGIRDLHPLTLCLNVVVSFEHRASSRAQRYAHSFPSKAPGAFAAERFAARGQPSELAHGFHFLFVDFHRIGKTEKSAHQRNRIGPWPQIRIIEL